MISAFDFYCQMLNKAKRNKQYWTFSGKDVLYFPMEVPQGITIVKFLDDMYTKYREIIASIDDFVDDSLYEEVHNVCKNITDTLKYFLSGDIITAYNSFSNLMIKYINNFPTKKSKKTFCFIECGRISI